MHLLGAERAPLDSSQAVDLGQSSADMVFLSSADSELSLLSRVYSAWKKPKPSLRLANLALLSHPFSVDRYGESVISHASLVIVRLLGGVSYWPYGVERLAAICRERDSLLALLPGHDEEDRELARLSTCDEETWRRLWGYCVHGGSHNADSLLRYGRDLLEAKTAPKKTATGKPSPQKTLKGETLEGETAPQKTPKAKTLKVKTHSSDTPKGETAKSSSQHTWQEPQPLLPAGIHWPGRPLGSIGLAQCRQLWKSTPWKTGARKTGAQKTTTRKTTTRKTRSRLGPRVALIFYRALVQAGETAAIDGLIHSCLRAGLRCLPLYVSSLKDNRVAAIVTRLLDSHRPEIIINATGFSIAAPLSNSGTLLDRYDCPVLQVLSSSMQASQWRSSVHGLDKRDLAMHVVLPEVDGRLITRAVSFRGKPRYDPATQSHIVPYAQSRDRADHVTAMAKSWGRLRRTKPHRRRIAIILANYPNRDGRLANGVGLDTPASLIVVLRALAQRGYDVRDIPQDGDAIIQRLLKGPTNQLSTHRERAAAHNGAVCSLIRYRKFFRSLPKNIQRKVQQRWGDDQHDPYVYKGGFPIAGLTLGNVIVALQPPRGYHIDPQKSYHDPHLPPPHAYLAFYSWMRQVWDTHAFIHLGKHGNLEWLPGKSVALSRHCFPEIALGTVPNLYPFIVNDPGEGTQAKRRAHATIIDHLTPPMTKASSYGGLSELEALSDEYFLASSSDPRRLTILRREILALAQDMGLDHDCGLSQLNSEDEAMAVLDTHLCELKEMQIRDGLHIFGQPPASEGLSSFLLALDAARADPRPKPGDSSSLLRALVQDLDLEDFDPHGCDLSLDWQGPRPSCLIDRDPTSSWRHQGDTVERLESLATSLIEGHEQPAQDWLNTRQALRSIHEYIHPLLNTSADKEIDSLLRGLDGRFVPPGPSGAPTRGRLDVLPTGRNFYSVDTRAVPTAAAWQLGWESAQLLVEDYRRRKGAWPRHMALSAWGTANMRTGGEDIAQAMALLGTRPQWDSQSRRVIGVEIMPLELLDRPRVDVTLRISGFFRDAFPNLIALFSRAVHLVASQKETDHDNPVILRCQQSEKALKDRGIHDAQAQRWSRLRMFSAPPGAYGTGLQSRIDESAWKDEDDLAQTWLEWGSYGYDGTDEGVAQPAMLQDQLRACDAVVHNQDNREHDILDSDDYYQFEGGMALAVRSLSGQQPVIYHNDHAKVQRLRIRTLEEEVGRIVRGRAANPKWIASIMRHGYKGAFEIAATVDYLFAFAVTAKVVGNHHFDALYRAYIEDSEVRSFIASHNPAALAEIAARFTEAIERKLWYPQSNQARGMLHDLIAPDANSRERAPSP